MFVLRPMPRLAATAFLPLLLVAAGVAPASAEVSGPPLRYVLPSINDVGAATPSIRVGDSIVVGDFDDDGQSDVMVPTIAQPSVVTVLLSTGGGGFAAPEFTSLPAGTSLVTAAAARVDGDGVTDLVAATISSGGPEVRVLLGDGDGTFTLGQQVQLAGNSPIAVAVGDVDGDGNVDYAAAVDSNLSGSVIQVGLGRGDGTFRAPASYTPDIYISPSDHDLSDVNADGAPDLVFLQGCPTVRLNTGDGTFGPEICSTDPEGRIGGVAQAVADFDEDGFLDLATGDASGGHVTISIGDGAGRFTFFRQYDVGGNQVDWITAADFTGDGHVDVVAAADAFFSTPTRVTVQLRGSGTGTFPKRTSYATGGDGVAPIDLNGDADLDLVAANLRPGTVSGVPNAGGGRFLAPRAYKGTDASAVSTILRSADINGDSRPDVVSVSFGIVYVRLMNAKGQLGRRLASPGSGEILSLDLGDLDGDGNLDVIAGTFPSENVFVMLGRGNGKFRAPRSFNNGSGAAVLGVAAGDVTGDGILDVVSNTFTSVSVLKGKGDGTFAAPMLSGSGGGDQRATLLGDVTGDGDTDAVSVVRTGTADNAKTTVTLNEGTGTGSFTVGQSVTVDTNVTEAELLDLGSDGAPDVALVGVKGTHSGRTGLFVLRNVAGQLSAATYYGGPAGGMTTADLNSDGKPDVATIRSSTLQLFTSRADGSLAGAGDLPAGPDATDVAAAARSASRVDVVELDSGNPEQLVVYRDSAP